MNFSIENVLIEDVWEDRKRVFVVLFDTKTAFSYLAQNVTKSKWNHISISFEEGLSELFSFDYSANGFREETLSVFKRGTEYLVYFTEVPEKSIKEMKKKISEIKNDPSQSYSLVTMLKAGINRYNRAGYFTATFDNDQMVCSTFVQSILSTAGVEFYSDNRVMSPSDFLKKRKLTFLKKGVVK